MDDRGFDALTRVLALGGNRRGVLAGLAGVSASGWSRLAVDAKKKKKKKKKTTCKGTNSNCTSGAQCCAGLVCTVGTFEAACESVDGDVCCRTLGSSCSSTCDCCGSASICGDDDKCCVVNLGVCAQDSDCCGENFCVDQLFGDEKTCRADNFGAPCDENEDCLGGLRCIDEQCQCILFGNACTDDGDCCAELTCEGGFCA